MKQFIGKGKNVKVKIISHSGSMGDSTEKRINKWLEENCYFDVLDIRYNETVRNDGEMNYHAIILYKEVTGAAARLAKKIDESEVRKSNASGRLTRKL